MHERRACGWSLSAARQRLSRLALGCLVGKGVRREVFPVGRLVERTVEGGNEEHYHLGTHAKVEHDVCAGQVGELEERSEDNYRRAPAIRVVEEGLARYAVEPFLQAVDYVELAVYCHLFLDFFIFSLVVLARLRTQRKPMYERGWFWYS